MPKPQLKPQPLVTFCTRLRQDEIERIMKIARKNVERPSVTVRKLIQWALENRS